MAFSLHVHASDDVSGCVQLAPDSTQVAGIVERYRTVVLGLGKFALGLEVCLLYTSPSPRDEQSSRMPSSA